MDEADKQAEMRAEESLKSLRIDDEMQDVQKQYSTEERKARIQALKDKHMELGVRRLKLKHQANSVGEMIKANQLKLARHRHVYIDRMSMLRDKENECKSKSEVTCRKAKIAMDDYLLFVSTEKGAAHRTAKEQQKEVWKKRASALKLELEAKRCSLLCNDDYLPTKKDKMISDEIDSLKRNPTLVEYVNLMLEMHDLENEICELMSPDIEAEIAKEREDFDKALFVMLGWDAKEESPDVVDLQEKADALWAEMDNNQKEFWDKMERFYGLKKGGFEGDVKHKKTTHDLE